MIDRSMAGTEKQDRWYLRSITEISGELASPEDQARLLQRYHWAADFCAGKEILELACGSGQGLAFLTNRARSAIGADLSLENLEKGRRQHPEVAGWVLMDAHKLPFSDASADVILILEALYFMENPVTVLEECHRVLRPGGSLLISVNNKDMPGFHRNQYGCNYFNLEEVASAIAGRGFSVDCFTGFPVADFSLRQKFFSPIKALAGRLGLIPRSMFLRQIIKPLVFGRPTRMPVNLSDPAVRPEPPSPVSADLPTHNFKILYCIGRKAGN